MPEETNKLYNWARQRQIQFNRNKCNVMNIGKNFNHSYTLMSSELVVISQGDDVGITMDSSMKTSAQCAVAVKKASKLLGCIKERIWKNIMAYIFLTGLHAEHYSVFITISKHITERQKEKPIRCRGKIFIPGGIARVGLLSFEMRKEIRDEIKI